MNYNVCCMVYKQKVIRNDKGMLKSGRNETGLKCLKILINPR